MSDARTLARSGSAALSATSARPAVQLAIFAASYLAVRGIEQTLTLPGWVVPIALSQGLAVGVISRFSPNLRVASGLLVVLSSSIVGLIGGMPTMLAVSYSLLIGGSALAAGWLLAQLGPRAMPRWEGFLALIVLAIGVATVCAGGWLAVTRLLMVPEVSTAMICVWLASFSGVVLATPAVVMFRRSRVQLTVGRLIEFLAALSLTFLVVALALGLSSPSGASDGGVRYILVPLVLWFAIRFGLAITAGVSSVLNLAIVIAAHNGFGPYTSDLGMTDSLINVQIALTLISLAIFAVALNEEQRRTSDLQLLAAHGMVESLLNNSDAMISVVSYDSYGLARYQLANAQFARTLGIPVSEVVGRRQDDLAQDPASAARQHAEDLAVIESNHSQVFVTRTHLGTDRHESASRVLLVTKFPVATAEEDHAAVGSVAIDITDHRRRERLMRLTFDESPVPMVRLAWRRGRAGEVLDANRSAARLLQTPVSNLVSRDLSEFTHVSERGIDLIAAETIGGLPRRREARLITAAGDDVWVTVTATVVEANADDGMSEDDQFALVVFEDISARKAAEQTLTHQALHDALTGVLNRYALIDRLEAALNRLWRANNNIAVLFCDLDGFKNLNDTLGHRAGDQLLVSVSERLRNVMRPQDTVARLGGDEFVLICEDLPGPGQARVIGERIRESMRAPFQVDGRDYGVTVSVGIATTTDASTRAEDLLRRADLAMYRAKDNGRNRVEYYAEELEARAVAHVEAAEALRRAIETGQIVVHYQPIIDTKSGRIVGVEALARLRGADGVLIHPSTFISVAESSGLVTPLGERVLDQALDQLQVWTMAGFDVQMNVNVSPRQLSRASFAPNVFERMMARSLPPHSLCLEITEGAVVDATGPTLITLRRLRSYGVHVGIDDFGTGYSSLTTLKHLPADVLKVDKSFVEGLGSDANDSAIVAAVINVAHDLGCVVVAEGVESERQINILRSMDCDQVQGYRYGRPVAAEAMTELLRQGRIIPVAIDLTDSSDLNRPR